MGLGLYIVKKITELLKARIAVESQVGIGSVFTLALGHLPSPDEHRIGWTVSALRPVLFIQVDRSDFTESSLPSFSNH